MLHSRYCENCPLVQEKIFKGSYHKWTWQPSCHVTSIISVEFYFHVPESLHTKFDSK